VQIYGKEQKGENKNVEAYGNDTPAQLGWIACVCVIFLHSSVLSL